MIKFISGDLIALARSGEFDIIVHGCNCFNTMGAGVAKQIKNVFPAAAQADAITIKGDKSKLGDFTYSLETTDTGQPLIVMNAYTQYRYGTGRDLFDYFAFRSFMQKLRNYAHLSVHNRIGMPLIGCGHAGGDMRSILTILEEESEGLDITIVQYDKEV